jgi:hypothetical protein
MNASREHNEKGSTLQLGVHIWLKAASREAKIDCGNSMDACSEAGTFLEFPADDLNISC